MIGVFASMATSLAIRDLQASQHQVIDQLKALQEAVAALNAASAHQQIPPPSASPHGAETRRSITRHRLCCGP
jgi:hypothetical protein